MRDDEKKNGSGWLRRLLVEHPAFLFSALYLFLFQRETSRVMIHPAEAVLTITDR